VRLLGSSPPQRFQSLFPTLSFTGDRLLELPDEPTITVPYYGTFYLAQCETKYMIFDILLNFATRNAAVEAFSMSNMVAKTPTFFKFWTNGGKVLQDKLNLTANDIALFGMLKLYSFNSFNVWSIVNWFGNLNFFGLLLVALPKRPDTMDEVGYTRAFMNVFEAVTSSTRQVARLKSLPLDDKVYSMLESHWGKLEDSKVDFKLLNAGMLRVGCHDLKKHDTRYQWKTFVDVCFLFMEKRIAIPGKQYVKVEQDSTIDDHKSVAFLDDEDPQYAWQLCTTTWRFEIDGEFNNWQLKEILETEDFLGEESDDEDAED
jgi:hypothetical protein